MKQSAFFFIIFITGLCVYTSSCTNKHEDQEEIKKLLLTGKKYSAEGIIEAIDMKEKKVRIRHGDIKGFMEPMTMWFKIADEELLKVIEKLNMNDKVRFELIGNPSGMSVVINILKLHQ